MKRCNQKELLQKILKLYGNNQYGFGMTRTLPTGCVKIDSQIFLKTSMI